MGRRSTALVVAGAAAVFVAGAGWAATQLVGGVGAPAPPSASASAPVVAGPGPEETGRAFLAAWAQRRYDRMQELVEDPNDDMQRVYGGLAERLQISRVAVTPGSATTAGSAASLPFRATLTVAGHPWSYDGRVPLTSTADGWRVAFTSDTVHPQLRNGRTLELQSVPATVRLLDRAGRDLAADEDLDQNLLGEDGVSGLRRVAATSGAAGSGAKSGPTSVVVTDVTTGDRIETLASWGPARGDGVRTTLDLRVQAAAEKALARIPGTAALVAVDTRTGEVRALANQPATGIPPALTPYAPGSTFKIITAAAALANGATPATRVDCPRSVVIHGRTLHNHEQAELGRVTLTTAFAQSCNTAFATLGSQLPDGALDAAARRFGFGLDRLLPVASPGGELPAPDSPAQAVEDTIGQGSVTASPLAMAAVAAAVADGAWRQPHVLPCPDCAVHAVPQVAQLRVLMRAVVTSGTGTRAAAPGGPVYGKTGTAEYGTSGATHAWFVGWQGRLAFAVFAEEGSSGGAVAAPAAARFLAAVPAASR